MPFSGMYGLANLTSTVYFDPPSGDNNQCQDLEIRLKLIVEFTVYQGDTLRINTPGMWYTYI
jgi:hypothetical protein